MRTVPGCAVCCTSFAALLPWAAAASAQQPPATGPQTEKRFPPLRVPAGFQATLFACDPFIEYPSVIAVGPRVGSLFVAVDYMTGLGTEIVRRDEIRLIEDADGDGYADRSIVYAGGFNSIQGLAHRDGVVYVMHAPLLTALRDTDGDGRADERRDLLSGLGLPPEKNPVRLHCANGVVPAHDGRLYLAMGDNGVDVPRPEGDRLVLNGGGILRCRPDGTQLQVFATGLRNIYDVALDEDLNVFVRDNENDGGDYKIRVCHSFAGADHGYPYLYYERPDEALPPIADLGLGSSAGGVCYLERQFPPEYRGDLFFCEWGRSVVHYRPRRAGAGFAPVKEAVFAAGAENDPYGFKPTDLVVDHDGSLLVSDWADGQRPRRGRGRIYRIRAVAAAGVEPTPATGARRTPAELVAALDSDSLHQRDRAHLALERLGAEGRAAVIAALDAGRPGVRARLHAVWLIAGDPAPAATERLFGLAERDGEPRVRAQAVRALADRFDPVLVGRRLDAGPGDAAVAARLAGLTSISDERVALEVVAALGRLKWPEGPAWAARTFVKPDATLAHALQQMMRQSGNWPAVLSLLDRPSGDPIRAIALRAAADRAEVEVVDGLIARLHAEKDAARRHGYADLLTRVYKRPGPWVYWGYRPAPRPANTVAWERTEAIAAALDGALLDPDPALRTALLSRMVREKVATNPTTLGARLKAETDAGHIGAILAALREHPPAATRDLLETVIASPKLPTAARRAALAVFAAGLDDASRPRLAALAGSLEDGPVLADALRRSAALRPGDPAPLLLRKLDSTSAEVRAAALDGLAVLAPTEPDRRPADALLLRLLADRDADVRRAAATAVGRLSARKAAEPLPRLALDLEPAVRRSALDALTALKDGRGVPAAVKALDDSETLVAALRCLSALGGPEHAAPVIAAARRNNSAEVVPAAVQMLLEWSRRPGVDRRVLERSAAELQGASGLPVGWRVEPPVSAAEAGAAVARRAAPPTADGADASTARTVFAAGVESRVALGSARDAPADAVRTAYVDLVVGEPTPVQFLGGAEGSLRVWLNGHPIFRRDQTRPFAADSDRFDGALAAGWNRVLVQVSGGKGEPIVQLRFRRRSTSAEHEKLTQAALSRPGNVERGRRVFLDPDKSQCLKCHRLNDAGERIGPELTGVGNRFSRIHLVESVLEPSRTIAAGYQTLAVRLADGRVFTGVKIAENDSTVTLADNQGRKTTLPKAEIEAQKASPISTMPDGLEKKLTADEFVDLIAFLALQREGRP